MGSAIQSQTWRRLRKPVQQAGSLDRRFDRSSSHSALSSRHQRAVQLLTDVSADCHARHRGPCQLGHLVVQSRPNRVVVRSPEGRQDRGHRSPATLRRWRLYRASGGLGCDGRLSNGCGSLVCPLRGSEPGVRHSSWVSRRSIDGAWVPLQIVTSRNDGQGGYRAGGRLPVGLAAGHHGPRDPRHFVGQCDRGQFARPAL
jgi:hypothetical protein